MRTEEADLIIDKVCEERNVSRQLLLSNKNRDKSINVSMAIALRLIKASTSLTEENIAFFTGAGRAKVHRLISYPFDLHTENEIKRCIKKIDAGFEEKNQRIIEAFDMENKNDYFYKSDFYYGVRKHDNIVRSQNIANFIEQNR